MDEENCQRIFLNSVLTSIYIPTIFVLLNYTNTLYDLGKQAIYIEWVLIVAELLKYVLCHIVNQQGKRKPKKSGHRFEMNYLFESISVLLVSLAVFYFGAVVFGAPVLSQHYETFFFALLMTILTALPCVLHVDIENIATLFLSIFEGTDLNPYYFWNIRLTVFGAWVGAVVIPLDWNKPYQKWPIPCCIGAMTGCYFANIFSLLRSRFHKRKSGKFNLCKSIFLSLFPKLIYIYEHILDKQYLILNF